MNLHVVQAKNAKVNRSGGFSQFATASPSTRETRPRDIHINMGKTAEWNRMGRKEEGLAGAFSGKKAV